MVVSAMTFALWCAVRLCETKASFIAATQAHVHFFFLQHQHQQCKTPGLLQCHGMKEDENWRNHSESLAGSLNGWDMGSTVRAETKPGWVGNPVVYLHPLEGMHSVGGWVFQIFEDFKDSKSLLHDITQEESQSSAQVDLRGRWNQWQVVVSDLQCDRINFAIEKGKKLLREKSKLYRFYF